MIATFLLAFLGSSAEELLNAPAKPDYHIEESVETLEKITSLIHFPNRFNEGLRWLSQRCIMSQLYPAQNIFWKIASPKYRTKTLDRQRVKAGAALSELGFIVRHVILQKGHTRYSGLLIAHEENRGNRKWVLQATGNTQPVEFATDFAIDYYQTGYNLLLINGPGVGRSQGMANPTTLGEAQLMGLHYLENVMDAKKIVIAGFSLGGAAVGQAILMHHFDLAKRDYLVVRQMTFDKVSNICKHFAIEKNLPKTIAKLAAYLQPIAATVIEWTGCEIDSIAASRKLEELSIPETIIQAGNKTTFADDGVIPSKASLGHGLAKEEIITTKSFYNIPGARHSKLPIDQTLEAIRRWDTSKS